MEDVNSEVVDEVEKAEEVEEQRNDREQEEEQKEEEAPKSFEELGLDSRLIRALTKKGIEKPTLIQQSAIPYILVMIIESLYLFFEFRGYLYNLGTDDLLSLLFLYRKEKMWLLGQRLVQVRLWLTFCHCSRSYFQQIL